MKVVGVVGLPGSGKSEAAAVAREEAIPVVTMGDVVRAECRDRGMETTERNLGRVATSLREEGGDAAIADRSLPLIGAAAEESDTVLVDGIRGIAEVETFRDAFGDDFYLVEVEAPFEERLRRIQDRARDPTAEDRDDLRERDERETGYGMDDAMAAADVRIDNTGSLAAFRDRIRSLLDDGPTALADDPAVELAVAER